MEEFFKEIFRMFVEYENDLTVYCFEDDLEKFHCEMPNVKELSQADKQLLKRVSDILGANYKSKLAHLFASAVKYAETGEGSVKVKKPDGSISSVPIAQLMGGADPQKKDKLVSFLNVAKKVVSKVKEQAADPNSTLNQGARAIGKVIDSQSSPNGSDKKSATSSLVRSIADTAGVTGKINDVLTKLNNFSDIERKIKDILMNTVAPEIVKKVNEPVIKELQEIKKQIKVLEDEVKKLNK
jgi:hypothetical protein